MSVYDQPVDPFASPRRPRRLDDAAHPYDRLDHEVPLGSRWPDWRLLLQTTLWYAPGLPILIVPDLPPDLGGCSGRGTEYGQRVPQNHVATLVGLVGNAGFRFTIPRWKIESSDVQARFLPPGR